MTALLNYIPFNFEGDFVPTFPKEAQEILLASLKHFLGFALVSSEQIPETWFKDWCSMCNRHLEAFVADSQNIIPALVEKLKKANPTMDPKFFDGADKLPLLPPLAPVDEPAWVFNGKWLEYDSGDEETPTLWFDIATGKLI